MSYHGWAFSAWTVDWKFIKSVAPKEAKAFEDACNEESSMYEIAFSLDIEDEIDTNIEHLLTDLSNRFREVTGGLDLSLGFIGEDETDSEKCGAVWFVGGVEEKTPAGKKYEKDILYHSWIEYG